MLNHSFVQIPSIGLATEKKFWTGGIGSMDEFIKRPPGYLSVLRQKTISEHICLSINKLKAGDAIYFSRNLPPGEHWRIFKEYRNSTAYIDIETTGLGGFGDIITTIALYDGKSVRHYIQGKNLEEFRHDIMEYKVIVTYNGKTFDLPFIEKYFGISISHAHIDLRYVLRSLGYSGGLKACERRLNIGRTGCLEDMDGFFAVLLWKDYKKNHNDKSLETLLSYNVQDVLSLEYLMVEAYNRKLCDIPLHVDSLDLPKPPVNPFKADASTIRRIKQQHRID